MNIGKPIILIGIAIVIIGLIVYFFGDKLSWLGKLPGDIRIENEKSKIFIPITTMILLSAILNLVLWLIKKYL